MLVVWLNNSTPREKIGCPYNNFRCSQYRKYHHNDWRYYPFRARSTWDECLGKYAQIGKRKLMLRPAFLKRKPVCIATVLLPQDVCKHSTSWFSGEQFYDIKTCTHWGRVTHICVGKLTIIGSDNGLSPGRRQAIIWTNPGILLIGPLGTNFSEILSKIRPFP